MKMKNLPLAVLTALALQAPGAHAVTIAGGTAELTTYRLCTTAGVTGCDAISAAVQQAYGGLPGDGASASGFAVSGQGSSSGSVALSGTVGAPVLRAIAVSEPGTRWNTNSAALQRYTFAGLEPTTRMFGGVLTYSQTVTADFSVLGPGVGGGVTATLEVFRLASNTIEVDATAEANFSMLSGGFRALSGYESLASFQYRDLATNLNGLGSLAVTVDLNPGDTVWVSVFLQTPAPNGSVVDASNTLITAWDNPTNLVPATPVPEAPVWLTMAVGLGLLFVRRWRGRSDLYFRARTG